MEKSGGFAEKAYQIIKADITNGKLRPGELLVESRFSKQIHISRTPVREAIRRLEGIDCRGKGTSCPDQFARALREAMTQRTAAE